MFNLFKKKKKNFPTDDLTTTDMDFLNTVANALADRFPNFRKQIELGVIVGKIERFVYGEGTYYFELDGDKSKKMEDKAAGYYHVTNILFSNKSGRPENLKLYVLEGVIYGYQCTASIEELDLPTINVHQVWVKRMESKDDKLVASFFKGFEKKFLSTFDLGESFKIELNKLELYTIKNLQDGNYLAINAKGEVYELIHDPYSVKKVFENVDELYHSGKYT